MPVEVRGLVELRKDLERKAEDLRGRPFVDGMRKATLLVMRDAKTIVPVDTGRLKNSITGEVTVEGGKTVRGVVGTNVKYGPYMELGTRAHFPPLAALRVWAKRHGMNAFLVAKSIAAKGLKPRYYLKNAFERNRDIIKRILNDTVKGIVES